MKVYEVHPLATLFPAIDGPAMAELVADIREHGLREPITLFEGRVLDGRTRAAAAHAAGVEPRFVEWQPAHEKDTPEAFVISANLHRRHLNDSQRAMIGARISTERGDWRKRTQPTQAEAAKLLNVKPSMIRNARTVIKHGTPAQVAAIDGGEKRVGTAYSEIYPRNKPKSARNNDGDTHTPEHENPLVREIFDWIEAQYERERELAALPIPERSALITEFAELMQIEVTIGHAKRLAKRA